MNSAASSAFLARLEAKAAARELASQPAWLQELRRGAWQWLSEQGFPMVKDEAWKYTRVAPILAIPFQPAEPGMSRLSVAGIERLAGDLGGPRLVFVNGYFAAQLSKLDGLPPGIQVSNLAALLRVDDEDDSGALEA